MWYIKTRTVIWWRKMDIWFFKKKKGLWEELGLLKLGSENVSVILFLDVQLLLDKRLVSVDKALILARRTALIVQLVLGDGGYTLFPPQLRIEIVNHWVVDISSSFLNIFRLHQVHERNVRDLNIKYRKVAIQSLKLKYIYFLSLFVSKDVLNSLENYWLLDLLLQNNFFLPKR